MRVSPWARNGHADDGMYIALGGVGRDGRQHADHGVHAVVHLESAPDDARVAVEAGLPILVTEDEDRIGARTLVGGDEGAPGEGPDADHVEEVGRDDAGRHPVRFAWLSRSNVMLWNSTSPSKSCRCSR